MQEVFIEFIVSLRSEKKMHINCSVARIPGEKTSKCHETFYLLFRSKEKNKMVSQFHFNENEIYGNKKKNSSEALMRINEY